MRSIGIASRALDLLLERVSDPVRKTFGKELREHGTVLSDIARSRAEIDQARLLVLSAARKVDTHGAKAAMREIGIAKVCPPPCIFVARNAHQLTYSSPFPRLLSGWLIERSKSMEQRVFPRINP
jgi:alkylation response protein AidB-like acyl-CoA dehydrogenase